MVQRDSASTERCIEGHGDTLDQNGMWQLAEDSEERRSDSTASDQRGAALEWFKRSAHMPKEGEERKKEEKRSEARPHVQVQVSPFCRSACRGW